MKFIDGHYDMKGDISLFHVSGTTYHFTVNAELLYRPNPKVNQMALNGIIIYDNEKSVVEEDNLNYRYETLPENVRNNIRANMMELATKYFKNNKKGDIDRDSYGRINVVNLLTRIKAIYGEEVFKEKAESIKAGPGFVERMEEFYDWCYENEILPL